MANAVITTGGRSVRLPYRYLRQVLAVTRAEAGGSAARRALDPWIAHVGEDLGYVDPDAALPGDVAVLGALREALSRALDAATPRRRDAQRTTGPAASASPRHARLCRGHPRRSRRG